MVFIKEQNITLVGDIGCGKSSLVNALKRDKLSDQEISADPFILVSHTEDSGHLVKVLSFIWDIPSFQDWKTFHPFYYGHTDVVILCFSLDSPESLKNASKKWMLEIRSYCRPETPVILVANKLDLRGEHDNNVKQKKNNNMVTAEEGKATAEKIGAIAYVECSAYENERVKQVFLTAIKAPIKMKENCCIDSPEKHTTQCCIIN